MKRKVIGGILMAVPVLALVILVPEFRAVIAGAVGVVSFVVGMLLLAEA